MLDSRPHNAPSPLPVRIFDVSDQPAVSAPTPSARALVFGPLLALAGWVCIGLCAYLGYRLIGAHGDSAAALAPGVSGLAWLRAHVGHRFESRTTAPGVWLTERYDERARLASPELIVPNYLMYFEPGETLVSTTDATTGTGHTVLVINHGFITRPLDVWVLDVWVDPPAESAPAIPADDPEIPEEFYDPRELIDDPEVDFGDAVHGPRELD